jgi:hypothetical protein
VMLLVDKSMMGVFGTGPFVVLFPPALLLAFEVTIEPDVVVVEVGDGELEDVL